ncbi:MAG: hypothetical protein KatS3mg087_0487 [Patescibacteria group bacterium]|nr:MAG: hypothetical protein KatS3mg087_0487 [Patescibacteria group bacterium]
MRWFFKLLASVEYWSVPTLITFVYLVLVLLQQTMSYNRYFDVNLPLILAANINFFLGLFVSKMYYLIENGCKDSFLGLVADMGSVLIIAITCYMTYKIIAM